MENNIIPLNIVIADRTYRIKADAHEEEMIRSTVKYINDKVIEFKTNFAGKDMQDYLSMVILWYATQQQQPVSSPVEMNEVDESLKRFIEILDSTLKD